MPNQFPLTQEDFAEFEVNFLTFILMKGEGLDVTTARQKAIAEIRENRAPDGVRIARRLQEENSSHARD